MGEADPVDQPDAPIAVGRIVSAHGIRGEVKVEPLTDFPERFDKGAELLLDGAPLRIETSRWQEHLVVLKLSGVASRGAAELLRGKRLMVPEPRVLLEHGRYYQHEIVGLRVEDENGEHLGEVADVLATGANDVYVVRGERGELLLPAVEPVIKEVDVAGGRLVVELMPGLEFKPPTPPRRRSTGIQRRLKQ
ncbi:MAG TPA: ribosome maturation factor RimM [Dehalococcoidia bacterium]|nr:ribosome maturation factor RimM [Dehalococcoidia bacterium]